MEVLIEKIYDNGICNLYATIETKLSIGDRSYMYIGGVPTLCIVDNSNIEYCTKIVFIINQELDISEGETHTAYALCKHRNRCGYPFCSSNCGGNDSIFIPSKEKRPY